MRSWLLTRHLLIRETQQAVVDIPFLALVVAALLVETGRPRARTLVPVLLCAAGLLRPEGWLLGLRVGRLRRPRPVRARRSCAGSRSRLAAPLLWALSDLVITGDPLYSLHGTQDLAEQLERPRAVGTALSAVPSYLRDALGDPLVWLGLAGAAGGLFSLYERTLLPAALAGLGILGFLALGVADLPLLIRYLLVPAVMLAPFCGLLLFGWTVVPRTDPAWRAWVAAGIVCFAVLAVFAPRQARALNGAREHAVLTAVVQDDLRRITEGRAFRSAAARCPALFVPDARPRALLAYWLERSPREIEIAGRWDGRRAEGLALVYARPEAAQAFTLTSPIRRPAALRCRPGTPRGAERLVAGRGGLLAPDRQRRRGAPDVVRGVPCGRPDGELELAHPRPPHAADAPLGLVVEPDADRPCDVGLQQCCPPADEHAPRAPCGLTRSLRACWRLMNTRVHVAAVLVAQHPEGEPAPAGSSGRSARGPRAS